MPLFRLAPGVGALRVNNGGKMVAFLDPKDIHELPSHWASQHVAAGNLVKADYPMLVNDQVGVWDGERGEVMAIGEYVRRMP